MTAKPTPKPKPKPKPKDELSENQKLLMTASANESVQDWRNELGNERLRKTRVLLKKLIREGDEKSLELLAEYFGVRLPDLPREVAK